jgi:hypothetical protein
MYRLDEDVTASMAAPQVLDMMNFNRKCESEQISPSTAI